MSSMLEEAIIDATALKEAAQKSAEEKIIEHFSKDIKEAVDLILEQDSSLGIPGMGASMAPTTPFTPLATPMPGANPMGWTDPAPGLIDIEAEGAETHEGESIVKQAPYAATTSDKDVVSIDLTKLEEALQVSLSTSGLEDTVIEEDYDIEDEREYIFSPGDDLMEVAEENEDEYQSLEEMVRAALTEDSDEDELFETIGCGTGPACAPDEKCECKKSVDPKTRREIMNCKCVPQPKTKSSAPMTMTEEQIAEAVRAILAEEMDDLFEDDTDPKAVATETACQKAARLKREAKGKSWTSSSDEKEIKAAVAACKNEKEKAPSPTQKESRASQRTLKEHKQLNKKVKLLEQKLNKYQEVFPQLKQQLEESSLQNARLHYQNRVLNSDSLNERQKDRLVETISKAKTVEEAKIIYETLQSAVGASALKSQPKSLNEVVTKRSSAFMPRKEEKRVDDTLAVRMKALAGITDK